MLWHNHSNLISENIPARCEMSTKRTKKTPSHIVYSAKSGGPLWPKHPASEGVFGWGAVEVRSLGSIFVSEQLFNHCNVSLNRPEAGSFAHNNPKGAVINQ